MNVRREDIIDGSIEAFLIEAERMGLMKRLPPEERQASKQAMIAQHADDEDIWVFGYGSLMWNPCVHYKERRPGLIHGYHRSFCFWVPLGRGSPDRPGLMLALEQGGACRGMAFRIAREEADHELDVIWNREMISGAYRPRLVPVATPEGPTKAITFVANRSHPRYAGRLPMETMADTIAVAQGRLGSCADYLFSTVAHLDDLGIADGPMHRLARLVRERQKAGQS